MYWVSTWKLFSISKSQVVQKKKKKENVFTNVTSSCVDLLQQKKAFTLEKGSTTTGLVWNTNMPAVLLGWFSNTTVTSVDDGKARGKD